MSEQPVRVLWLMNHATLRRFEVGQLRALGISEIYCPKRFPYDEANLSADVDVTLDASLSIPQDDLRILNDQNWYESPSDEAWRVANRHFRIAIAAFFPRQLASLARNFEGSLVMRVFGLAKGHSYTSILSAELGPYFLERLRRLGDRFWFGAGYEHLKDAEGDLFRRRNCFLPVGLAENATSESWRGDDRRVFFVCPRIGTSPYYRRVYEAFKTDFADFDYVIGGAQPIAVNDARVLGFVSGDVHQRNMRDLRVMFYHATEPNHVHYHPFEAIRAGMPLVFMAGGMLDRFGGKTLPGRCTTIREARSKIDRILHGDEKLITAIRATQRCLLEPLTPSNCLAAWREGLQRIRQGIDGRDTGRAARKATRRIAVIVPVAYRGGTLRAAKLLARALAIGSRQAGEDAEVVFGHLDDGQCYPDEAFEDLPPSIKRRPYTWRILEGDEVGRAAAYAGIEISPSTPASYVVPDDGIHQFMDCDLWVVMSDRLPHPLLPVRPYVLMVFDYLQRYESFLPQESNHTFLAAAHAAERVLVTTDFTRGDAIQYAGVEETRVVKLPMLVPFFVRRAAADDAAQSAPYFLWTTNLGVHKNHDNAGKALRLYYEKYGGRLRCHVTGVDVADLFESDLPHLRLLIESRKKSSLLRTHLDVLGELNDEAYEMQLSHSEFLWHAGRVDNGTFSVVEAASLGVPALSSDYPAMREINAEFALQLAWMDPYDADNMAQALKAMELRQHPSRHSSSSGERLASGSVDKIAATYWKAVRECL